MAAEEEMPIDSSCGLFGWRPTWLQMFKTPRWFVFILFLVFFLKGAPTAYYLTLDDVIRTNFGMSSEQFQWVISVQELGIIPIIVFFPLISFIPKKPVCLMLAAWVMAMGLLLCTISKFMTSNTSSSPPQYNFLTAGFFFFGLGSFIINALSIPYIDDNVPKEESPVYVGCVLAGGLSAQFFGGLLGEFVKNGGSEEDEFGGRKDIADGGEWWAGFVLIAFGLLFASPFLAMFPNRLTDEHDTEIEEDFAIGKSKNYFVDYLKSLRRLVSNKVFMLSLLSHVFSLSVVLGFGNNFSVFLMFMFNQTSQEAKIGVVMAVTIILSSFVLVAVGAVIKYLRVKVKY